MTVSVAYYSTTFIICLFLISRIISAPVYISTERKDKDINRSFLILCFGFVLWSISVVTVGVSQHEIVDKCFLFMAEFSKMGTFVSGTEVCASITDRSIRNRRTMFRVSSRILYYGILVLILILFFNRANINRGPFGVYLVMGRGVALIAYILFYVAVLFFYATYTYMYHYACKNKREYYISKQSTIIVIVLAIGLVIEAFSYLEFGFFVPSMYVGMVIAIMMYNRLIYYKRRIEYNESDYEEILSPLHQKPAFVCDDEGKIIFENTRAFVMRQTYKDQYIGKYLTDVFDITDYDVERLKEPRITQTFDVYCNYTKEQREMVLIVKHNLDKFGEIFSTEVEVAFSDEMINEHVTLNDEKTALDVEIEIPKLSNEEINELRNHELIKLIAIQKELFDKEEKILFEFNLKGIEKESSVLGLTALEELCGRIQTELTYGEWESLNQMIIDLDRQYETLSYMYY